LSGTLIIGLVRLRKMQFEAPVGPRLQERPERCVYSNEARRLRQCQGESRQQETG